MEKKPTKKEERTLAIIKEACHLFSTQGYYVTTISDIALKVGMSVGNMYNYFTSKEILAKHIIRYSSELLGKKIALINAADISTQQKIEQLCMVYLTEAQDSPEIIDYFLRVFLSNREVFTDGCEGFLCVNDFVTEVMILLEEGAQKGDLREQDFFIAFGVIMGSLAGFVFLSGEKVLPQKITAYATQLADNIWRALKV